MSNAAVKWFVKEFKEMVGITIYLCFIFSSFLTYRSLTMAQLGIEYHEYGFAIIKALVFAKVILIVKFVSVVKRFDDQPLIIPTVYKVVLFTLFSALFVLIEHLVRGLIGGLSVVASLEEITAVGVYEMISRIFVFVFALVPYFIMNEVSRVVGKGTVLMWFFRRRTVG